MTATEELTDLTSLSRWLEDAAGGNSIPLAVSPAEEYLREWCTWLVSVRGRSKRTARAYGDTGKFWLRYCTTHTVDPLTPELGDMEAFMCRPRLRQGHGGSGSASTRRGDAIGLRQWFKWMLARGYVGVDPTVDLIPPTVPRGIPKPISDGDWIRLWNLDMSARLRRAIGLGFACGIRRAEFDTLAGNKFAGDQIVNFRRKGGGGDTLPWVKMIHIYTLKMPHLLPNPEAFVEDMLTHARECGSRRMFWIDGQQMYKNMVALCSANGLPHLTPHMLRHSCATNMLRMGVPLHIVSELLNHSSYDITRGYVQVAGTELDEFLRTL